MGYWTTRGAFGLARGLTAPMRSLTKDSGSSSGSDVGAAIGCIAIPVLIIAVPVAIILGPLLMRVMNAYNNDLREGSMLGRVEKLPRPGDPDRAKMTLEEVIDLEMKRAITDKAKPDSMVTGLMLLGVLIYSGPAFMALFASFKMFGPFYFLFELPFLLGLGFVPYEWSWLIVYLFYTALSWPIWRLVRKFKLKRDIEKINRKLIGQGFNYEESMALPLDFERRTKTFWQSVRGR